MIKSGVISSDQPSEAVAFDFSISYIPIQTKLTDSDRFFLHSKFAMHFYENEKQFEILISNDKVVREITGLFSSLKKRKFGRIFPFQSEQ